MEDQQQRLQFLLADFLRVGSVRVSGFLEWSTWERVLIAVAVRECVWHFEPCYRTREHPPQALPFTRFYPTKIQRAHTHNNNRASNTFSSTFEEEKSCYSVLSTMFTYVCVCVCACLWCVCLMVTEKMHLAKQWSIVIPPPHPPVC